jgi:histidinol-phosphatase (PHP family)
MCVPDYHIHTYLCKHAAKCPQEYLEQARAKNLLEIGFADHAPSFAGFDPRSRMAVEQFSIYQNIIAEAKALNIIPVKYGIEADYYSGCEVVLRDWIMAQEFDYVLGSVHFIGAFGGKYATADLNQRERWAFVDAKTVWQKYFAQVLELVKTNMYDAVAHFDLPKKFGFIPPSDLAIKEMVRPVLDLMAKNDMALELNTSGLRYETNEIYPSPLILELAFERGIPIYFGSDAHTAKDVGFGFDKAISLAKDVGYKSCVQFTKREKSAVFF